ncbi:MAG: ATP-binding protein [Archangium sp.]|nr:ATP-binding protein [Archangium sp.]
MFQTTLPVVGPEFRDRTVQLARIAACVEKLRAGSPHWLALLGPRKVGKTSLLLETSRRVGAPVVFAILDVFDHVPVTDEVLRLLVLRVVDRVFAAECGQSLEATIDPDSYRAALSGSPRFATLPPDLRQLLLGLKELELTALTTSRLLDVPERLAERLGLFLVVAVDEFQELAALRVGRPAVEVLPMLRSAWQKHRRVSYVVSGSARSMMTDLVASQRSPFFGHFELMEVGEFEREDAVALLIDSAVPGRKVSRALAEKAVDTLGGNPFYLQLLGEQLAAIAAPLDDAALKEAVSRLLFHRTGRLALFFESELARVVGRSSASLALLEQLARGPARPVDLQRAVRLSSSSVVNYLARLGDIIRAREDGTWELSDRVMALWLQWRAPGGAAVPMTVIGDEGERVVAQALAELGFELVYQSKASRGAFDLLALRAGVMVGIQVKRSPLPLHFSAAAWKRMEAEAQRLGWLPVIASVTAEGVVTFLDPRKGRKKKGVSLSAGARIENLLRWVDLTSSSGARRAPPRRRARTRAA